MSKALLEQWCRAKHGRATQLAEAIGRTRMMIHHYRDPDSHHKPSEETAKRIEEATDGAVPADGW